MKHIVHKDQLFGYPVGSTQKQTLRMVVMRVDVSKGGDPTLIDRTISVGKVDIREAGPEDYEHFGVDNPGVKEFQVGDIISAIVCGDDKTSAASPPLQPGVEQTRFRRNLFENQ